MVTCARAAYDAGPMLPVRPRLLGVVTVALASIFAGCAGEAPPPRAPSASMASPPSSPVSPWLAHLRADDRQLKEAALAIAASGDAATRQEASRRLIGEARSLSSAAWHDANLEMLRRVDAESHLDPSPKQLEAQLDQYRHERLLHLVDAMNVVGGPEVVAYDFELAESEATPTKLRQALLTMLAKHADAQDTAARARASALWERVSARAAAEAAEKPRGGAVSNASEVVAGMQRGFRHCYDEGLKQDPDMKGSIRVTAKIGPRGDVLSVSSSGSGLSAAVVACLEARVAAAVFSPPEGGGATVVIPVTFVSVDPRAAPAPAPPRSP